MNYSFDNYKLKRARIGNCYMKPIEPDDFKTDYIPNLYVNGYFQIYSKPQVYKWNENKKVESFEKSLDKVGKQHELMQSGMDFNYWIFEEENQIKRGWLEILFSHLQKF